MRAGEGTLGMAEQLAFDECRNQRTAIHRDERLVAERSREMDGPGHHFLAGSAFSQDQHRMGAVRRLGDDSIQFLHFRRATDDAAESLLRFDLLAQNAVLALELQMAGDAIKQKFQLIEAERLGDIVVRAILHRLHGGLHSAIARHDHDHRVRTKALDAIQRLQSPCTGQAQIEQHGVNALRIQQAVRMLGRIGDEGIEAQRLCDLAAGLANGTLVINNQDVQEIGSLNLGSRGQGEFSSGHGFSRFRFSDFCGRESLSRISRNFSSSSELVNGFLKNTVASPVFCAGGSHPDM